jgi:hypothetical protein
VLLVLQMALISMLRRADLNKASVNALRVLRLVYRRTRGIQ